MTKEEKMLRMAEKAGFKNYKIIDTGVLYFEPRFRMYCEMNYCGNYDKNYSCPPACGEPEKMERAARQYRRVLVLQTITPVKDIMDDEETGKIKRRHNQMTWELIEDLAGSISDCLPAMAGPCGLCSPCEKSQGRPCRRPEKKASCLSAYCIKADALAEYCQIPYYCQGEVAFFSLLFFDREE